MQEGDGEQQIRRGVSRKCEVVRARIRLGYPYAWQIGIASTEDKRKCRLCGAQDEHRLEHYLMDCDSVSDLRAKCTVPSPTLLCLGKHFVNILPETLREHPRFCDIL